MPVSVGVTSSEIFYTASEVDQLLLNIAEVPEVPEVPSLRSCDETVLRPEMFGAIGVSSESDKAAWIALAAVANTMQRVRIVADGTYNINGSGVVFEGIQTLNIRLTNASFCQKTPFSQTIKIANCSDVRVHSGEFEGLGPLFGEYDGESSSWNGVAAIFFYNCDKVRLTKSSERNHAGGGFVVQGGRIRDFENVRCEGIGYPYIDPIGQSNQGNGSDFGIMCQPSTNNETQVFLFEDRFVNCRVFNHAFGIQTVATNSLIIKGCEIGPCPGQHGVYAIDCDGLNVQANTFRACRQFCFKQQFENYAGRFIGPLWTASQSYSTGDTVRHFGTLYRCKSQHTSAATFVNTNWEIHPLMLREGGIISNNLFLGEGQPQSQAIGHISTDESKGRYIFSLDLLVQGNVMKGFDGDVIYLDRCLDCDIIDNKINGGRFGMFLTDFRGRIKGNQIRKTRQTACYAAPAGEVWYEDNLHINCGLSGTNDENRTPSLLTFGRNSVTTIPDLPTVSAINYNRNEIRFTGSEGIAPFWFYGADSVTNWRVTETRCTLGHSKVGRVNGNLIDQFRNDFAGFYNVSQNEPVPTDAANLITNLRTKRVVK